jgi:hypothetical protein
VLPDGNWTAQGTGASPDIEVGKELQALTTCGDLQLNEADKVAGVL